MLTTFNITQQGSSHIQNNKPCQDYSQSMRIRADALDQDIVISAVSDGVGSCMFSQDGSREAVTAALATVSAGMKTEEAVLDDTYVLELLKRAFDDAYDAVAAYADEHEYPFTQLDSTLTVSIFDGTTIWFGHIGDDGIVAMYTDGTYEMITQRHKGVFVSSVFPLRETGKWEFGKSIKPVASFTLMTDGVLDYVVGSEFYDNRVFYPFIQPVLATAMNDDEQMEHLKQEFDVYLKDDPASPSRFRNHVSDDITIAVVQNSEAVAALPEIHFDMEEWDRQTEAYVKKAQESLYSSKHGPEVVIELGRGGPPQQSDAHPKPIVIDPAEETSATDSLTILTRHDEESRSDQQPFTGMDEMEQDLQKAALQVITDLKETGTEASRGLIRVGNSVRTLSAAIISAIQNRTKE